ncbi:hypothetical protein Hdeb2414_s0002g00055231 [Helianthus debilis subsp. tardiflorus]
MFMRLWTHDSMACVPGFISFLKRLKLSSGMVWLKMSNGPVDAFHSVRLTL